MHQQTLGDIVDFVIQVDSVQEHYTNATGEPYLRITGVDMDGMNVWPVLLWRFTEGELESNRIYILRGMKVAKQTHWCEWSNCYVPYDDNRQKIESSFKTAVEDVTDAESMREYFW